MESREPVNTEKKPEAAEIKLTTAFESQNWLSEEAIEKRFPKLPRNDVALVQRFVFQQGFGIETWYHRLAEHTFETDFLNLSDDEVRALVRLSDFAPLDNEFGAPTENDKAVLEKLCKRLDDSISKWGEDGAFVKLDTRSPKDAVVDRTKDEAHVAHIISLVEKELEQLMGKPERTKPFGTDQQAKEHSSKANTLDGKFSDSEVLAAFMRATTHAMRIQNGHQAVHDLFLHSRRAYEDLRRVLRFSEHEQKQENQKPLCAMSIAVRRWHNAVSAGPEGEFRGFVYGGKLQALTAYDNLIGYHSIIDNKKQIEERIRTFYEKELNPKLPGHRDGCVVDFFVDKDRIFLIEINPFGSGTGPSLFSWKQDRERLMNGPFEFRILHESKEDTLKNGMVPFWSKKLDKYVAKPQQANTNQQAEASNKGFFGKEGKIAESLSKLFKKSGEPPRQHKK